MLTCCPGLTTPVLGRTQYFLGDVVFTLKATASPVGLDSCNVVGTCVATGVS